MSEPIIRRKQAEWEPTVSRASSPRVFHIEAVGLEAHATVGSAAPVKPTLSVPAPPAAERLASLDAFRGAIMLLMASAGFGISQAAKNYPDNPMWRFFGYQCDHTEWTGCSIWDLIQPAFTFMVGVALPWSLANRRARGQSFGVMFGHALWRALLLVLLAVFLTSASSRQTEWVFTNVLAQIGWGYPFLFLMAGFIRESIKTHLGQHFFESFGAAWVPMMQRGSVLLVIWLILFWMYRRKIVVRI